MGPLEPKDDELALEHLPGALAPSEEEAMALVEIASHGDPQAIGQCCRTAEAAVDVPITGLCDFEGQRLHILQIGLGTFGTVVQHVAELDDTHPGVRWLLEAVSDASPSLRSVGVEPVPEHVARLRPALRKLPRSALVQAAVVRHGERVAVHALDKDCYQSCLRQVHADHLTEFVDRVLYLRNMSCVGQDHPLLQDCVLQLEQDFRVKIKTQAIDTVGITYGALTEKLRFGGVEVLMIDAEGHDCQILLSMIDHCLRHGNETHWPDVIQFESMGHCDKLDGEGSETAVVRSLESYGYAVVTSGYQDTQMVRPAALHAESRLQRWVDTISCDRCWVRGESGMPFTYGISCVCASCSDTFVAFDSGNGADSQWWGTDWWSTDESWNGHLWAEDSWNTDESRKDCTGDSKWWGEESLSTYESRKGCTDNNWRAEESWSTDKSRKGCTDNNWWDEDLRGSRFVRERRWKRRC